MGILKRSSYERERGRKVSDDDYELYLLNARPLSPSETQEERNQKIMKLLNKESENIEDKMLTEMNDFMKKYNISAINFGSHSVKKSKGKKAKK